MSSANRRRLLSRDLSSSSSGGTMTTRLAESVGVTAAECAAICCCCPCVMLTLAFCVLYKIPAGIIRRALKKRRLQRMMKRGMLSQPTTVLLKRRCTCGCDEVELRMNQLEKINNNNNNTNKDVDVDVDDNNYNNNKNNNDDDIKEEAMMVKELETEMWSRFYRTGFGRSPSQAERLKMD